MKSYFQSTTSLIYSYILCVPLLLLYEVLIQISQPANAMVRISVDAWLKYWIAWFGLDAMTFLLAFVGVVGLIIIYIERAKLKNLKLKYFGFMILESALYAVSLASIVNFVVQQALSLAQTSGSNSLNPISEFALALGAGLYEELFFRVILVSLLFVLFNWASKKKWFAATASVIIAALIFSAVHYTGNMADTFAWNSFLFRFFYGLALNALFVWRGFGVAVYTHAIYDLFVMFIF